MEHVRPGTVRATTVASLSGAAPSAEMITTPDVSSVGSGVGVFGTNAVRVTAAAVCAITRTVACASEPPLLDALPPPPHAVANIANTPAAREGHVMWTGRLPTLE